jgi:hypothetical protein
VNLTIFRDFLTSHSSLQYCVVKWGKKTQLPVAEEKAEGKTVKAEKKPAKAEKKPARKKQAKTSSGSGQPLLHTILRVTKKPAPSGASDEGNALILVTCL